MYITPIGTLLCVRRTNVSLLVLSVHKMYSPFEKGISTHSHSDTAHSITSKDCWCAKRRILYSYGMSSAYDPYRQSAISWYKLPVVMCTDLCFFLKSLLFFDLIQVCIVYGICYTAIVWLLVSVNYLMNIYSIYMPTAYIWILIV